LSDETIEYVTEQFRTALQEIEVKPSDEVLLKNQLQTIDTKLAKLADAIESVGISDTLAKRLSLLEQEKVELEANLDALPAPVTFLPDVVVPDLVKRWRELATSIESMTDNPHVTLGDIETARANLRSLLGTVTLRPRNGILWAHPAPNAKGLTEVRPLDGLRINSPFFGSGGVICSVPTVCQRIRLR
jgi:hypothetical protein